MKSFLLSLLLSAAIFTRLLSQGTDVSGAGKPGFYVGFNIISAQTGIVNDLPAEYAASSKNALSLNGSLEFGYFFSKNIGLSLGFGYGVYSTKLSVDKYESRFPSSDSEDDTCEMRVTGNQIIEKQKISFLTIPVCLIFQFPVSEKLSIFIQPGLQFAIPLSKKYTSSGVFTYTGYYSQYNILLSNLPDYGFPSNYNTTVSDDLKVKSLATGLLASAGISYSITKRMQLTLSINYSKSMSNISAYEENPEFQISEYDDNINSLMGVSSKTSVQAIGLKLGVRYLIK